VKVQEASGGGVLSDRRFWFDILCPRKDDNNVARDVSNDSWP